jgi:2'-5' RNA ligase superfamily
MQSALLLAVPAAEAAVGAHRARLDPSARDGVPAHITVLYPSLPPAEIGPRVLGGLSRLFAGVPRFSFILDQVRWFDESVVWLGPADESPFRALTELAAQAHPGCSPGTTGPLAVRWLLRPRVARLGRGPICFARRLTAPLANSGPAIAADTA